MIELLIVKGTVSPLEGKMIAKINSIKEQVNPMIDKRLPDYCYSGRKIKSVDGIIIHHFSCLYVDPKHQFEIGACYNLMCDLNLPRVDRGHYLKESGSTGRSYASAHLFIGRDGEIYQLMDFDLIAYHAGASRLNERDYCNSFTLGVELIGTANSGFTDLQYDALAWFCSEQMKVNGFGTNDIAGHDTVRFNAIESWDKPKREPKPKYDPSGQRDGKGDNFDWVRLYSDIDDLMKIATSFSEFPAA